MRLFAIGIHPSQLNACQAAYQRYEAALAPHRELAFTAGLQFLYSIGEIDLDPIEDAVRTLGCTRNHTYLEHGYQRVQSDQAKRCFEFSLSTCQHLLGPNISNWKRFEMRF